jgi:putative membrane protein
MQYYRLALAFHVVSIICWMAGILYLIRLFVYHAAESEAVVRERFKIMEYRLYRYITFPAMIASFIFGLFMIYLNSGLLDLRWMQIKLVLVILLAWSTVYSGGIVRDFASETNSRTERFFRFFNEFPTLLMLGIVFLVILKPVLF